MFCICISIAWCDVTQVYSFKAIGFCSYTCYLADILCASAIGNSSFTFCLLCETIMINVCNIQCYMLLIGVCNFVSHIMERI